jgi:hypothetical protein
MGNKGFQYIYVDIKGNGALNIHQNTNVIAYLQVGEIIVRLTSKKCD